MRGLKALRDLRKRMDIYLDDAELDQIRANAATARLPVSTFVRRVALRKQIDVPPPLVDVQRWRELAPLASNLNQIARACNAGRVEGIDLATIGALAEQVRLLRLELLGANLRGMTAAQPCGTPSQPPGEAR